MTGSLVVVIKVGGSLLDWPELPSRLADYLRTRRLDRAILIVGGGRFADALRDLDARQSIGEARSHALALRVLDLTAHVLATLLIGSKVVEDLDEIPASWSVGQIPILAPRRFLDEDDRRPDPLPETWSTTTDAIAARLADRLGAREVVLLKSAWLPPGVERSGLADLGLVDPEFLRAAANIPVVTYLNLRDDEARPRSLEVG